VHNSIPEYESTASILKPFEQSFWGSAFLLKYHQNPPSPQEMEHEKKKEKRKTLRVSSNKRGSQYFERRKTLQLQKFFLMWFHFLPLHHTILKPL
jgi:hypothetical protein